LGLQHVGIHKILVGIVRFVSPSQHLSAQDALDQGNNIFATIVVASFFVGFLCVASFLFSIPILDLRGKIYDDIPMYRTKMITSIYGFAVCPTNWGPFPQKGNFSGGHDEIYHGILG